MNPLHWQAKRGQERRRLHSYMRWRFQVSTFSFLIRDRSCELNSGGSNAVNLLPSVIFFSTGFLDSFGFAGAGDGAVLGFDPAAGLLSAGTLLATLLSGVSGMSLAINSSGLNG